MAENQKQTATEPLGEPKEFTVVMEIHYSVTATSITAAYKTVQQHIAADFNAAYGASDKPKIVPHYYEGLAVSLNRGSDG